MPNRSLNVLVFYPGAGLTRHLKNTNIITLSVEELWENRILITLCHEIMHFLTEEKFQNEQIGHALIELLCENELRIRLNKRRGGLF